MVVSCAIHILALKLSLAMKRNANMHNRSNFVSQELSFIIVGGIMGANGRSDYGN